MLRPRLAQLASRALLCSLTLAALAPRAHGDAAADFLRRRIAVERFELASTGLGILAVQGAGSLRRGQWDAALWAGYQDRPLMLKSLSTGDDIAPLIKYRVAGGLALSYGITSRVGLTVTMPLMAHQAQGDLTAAVATPGSLTSWGLGDVTVTPHASLLSQGAHGVDLAVMARLVVPTGRDQAYLTDGGPGLGATIALGRRWRRLEALANLGYQTRPPRELVGLEVDDEVIAKLGVRYALGARADGVRLGTALTLATRATRLGADSNAHAAELLAGAELPVGRLGQTARWTLHVAGGMGLSDGFGVPAWRALVGGRLVLGGASGARRAAPPAATSPRRPDADDDGLPDAADRCPTAAEVFNGIDDHDGCPDTDDRDNDGVHDAHDLCLEEAAPTQAPAVPHDKFGCPYPAP